MKKALALVLALVMVLSLAVSASALTLVDLDEVKEAGKKVVKYTDDLFTTLDETEYWCNDPYGGTFYVLLNEEGHKLENIEVATTGIVSAKVMDWDPETMVLVKEDGTEVSDLNTYKVVKNVGGKKEEVDWTDTDVQNAIADVDAEYVGVQTKEAASAMAKALNKYFKTSQYKVECIAYTYVIAVTVAPNYSAAYKEGSFKVKAYDTVTKKNLSSATFTVINDVAIFAYEEVKWAAEYNKDDEALYVFQDDGYSDYYTAKYGYETPDLPLMEGGARVISTTAFRAIQGKDITVSVFDVMNVNIEKVAAGQKGINFEPFAEICGVDVGTTLARGGRLGDILDNYMKFDKAKRTLKFGFLGDQTVASDFTITLDTGITYFELREFFLEKVEEDDIITFYVLKDGKKFDEFTVDFMTANYNDKIELTINGKAGTALGEYAITLTAPANGGEENPNTGAESMIGVVAALAVVSVAAAAAVSLKK